MSRSRDGRHPATPRPQRLKRPSMEQVRLLARLHGCRCRPTVVLARLGPGTFSTAIFHDDDCPLATDDSRGRPLRLSLIKTEPA